MEIVFLIVFFVVTLAAVSRREAAKSVPGCQGVRQAGIDRHTCVSSLCDPLDRNYME